MKFEELKNSLKEKIYPAYLLYGVDEFLLSSAYNLIIKYSQVEMQELNLLKFVEGVIDCDDVVRGLNTMPIFSNKKAVYLDLRMAKKSDVKNIKILNEYLQNPNKSAILIVNIGDDCDIEIDKNKFIDVDCNKLDYKIISLKIKAELKKYNKNIDDSSIQLLSDYCIGDLSKILIECQKLVAFVGEKENITSLDIKEIVSRSLEYQIYELTDGLSRKDSKKVFTIINDIENKKDEYKSLPSLIFAHFRRLFHISINKDLTNFELAKMLGIKEYAVKMSQKQVGLFSKSSLKKINDLCIKLDYDLKQSNITIENMVNLIILTILNMK